MLLTLSSIEKHLDDLIILGEGLLLLSLSLCLGGLGLVGSMRLHHHLGHDWVLLMSLLHHLLHEGVHAHTGVTSTHWNTRCGLLIHHLLLLHSYKWVDLIRCAK